MDDALKPKILELLDQHRLMTIATNRPHTVNSDFLRFRHIGRLTAWVDSSSIDMLAGLSK